MRDGTRGSQRESQRDAVVKIVSSIRTQNLVPQEKRVASWSRKDKKRCCSTRTFQTIDPESFG